MKNTIKDWPQQERPRERLILYGASSLSDAELLAIFLRSGTHGCSAVELARHLLQHFGDLSHILNADLEQLSQLHGIGPSKYTQLMAVKELGKRYITQQLQQQPIHLHDSSSLLEYLRFELLDETREVFAVLCLDAQLRHLAFKKLFFGGLNSCAISINQILRFAISQHATHLVIAHNHPFAQACASKADLTLTQQIQSACALVEIQLIDHCIIARDSSFSFAEHQLL
ncbi:DNA repair protein RadC [uncultured Acinetobacter sp.]|uniref:RadC family protein n=1 Tax=uncultured Acinetobacter sp. TaxID=165433 RepID=UPI002632AFC5|nr:DNA repair protein RadC [uncultured Acinetobacter sp.]